MNASTKTAAGFAYHIEIVDRDGVVRERETLHNLMPVEGLNHMIGVTLKSVAQINNWYMGLFEGNYSPVADDLASTFPGSAAECSAYGQATRVPLVLGAIAAGSVDNDASKGEFTMTAPKVIYGAFITGASAKGSTSSVLISAGRFSAPKTLDTGETLRLKAVFVHVSL
jgi:hypothetical protein